MGATGAPGPRPDPERYAWVPYPVGHRKRATFIRHYETMLEARARSLELAPRSARVSRVLASEAFRALRARATLAFDPGRHPILRAFRALVRDETGDLALLHERFATALDRARSHIEDKAALLAPLAAPSPERDAFVDAYDRVVLDVVVPHVARRMPSETRLLYAAFPCVRVQQPCHLHTIRVHVDAQYGHAAGSVNCWLPLTPTRAANALHLETAPGAEDFAPIELEHGELAVFDGTRCAHYTVPNATDRTRVSLDFRIVPGGAWDDHEDGPGLSSEDARVEKGFDGEKSDEGGGAGANGGAGAGVDGASVDAAVVPSASRTTRAYALGGYYSEARREPGGTVWRRTVAGSPCARHGFPHVDPEAPPRRRRER